LQDPIGRFLHPEPEPGGWPEHAQQGGPDRPSRDADQQRAARCAVHRDRQHRRPAQGSEDRSQRRGDQDERHPGHRLTRALTDYRSWRKAELHCHLDGALRQSTAEELAGRPLRLRAPDSCASQAEYISYFEDQISVLQTEAALERCSYELGVDSAAENIDYLEVRWAPRLHLRRGLSVEAVIA